MQLKDETVEQPKVQDVVPPESKPEESTAGAATSDVEPTTAGETAEGGTETAESGDVGIKTEEPEAGAEPEAEQSESTPEEGEKTGSGSEGE
jgi:hypothetical protein